MRASEFSEAVDLMPVPPIPDKLPELFTKKDRDNWQIPVSDPSFLELPEGYEPCKSSGGKYVKPLDRNGILRKVGEQWWESTLLDGKIVPVLAKWRGRIGTRHLKIDGFDDRKICGAFDQYYRDWCTLPRSECVRHCGQWSVKNGRACARPRTKDGGNFCAIHAKGPRSAIFSSFVEDGYKRYLKYGEQKIHDMLKSPDDTVEPEIQLLRTKLAIIQSSAGDSAAAWLELKDASQRFTSAKSANEISDAWSDMARIIQNGVDTVIANEEVRKTADSIVKATAVQAKMKTEALRTVSETQVKGLTAALIGIVAEILEGDVKKLALFNERANRLIEFKP